MATITLTGVSSGGTLTQAVTLSDADTVRLLTWAKSAYSVGTNAQAFSAMAQGVFAGLKANVLSSEQQTATTTAAAGVSPITLT